MMNSVCDVIIPVYNAPDWLELCVELVLKNNPDENIGSLILVDDGSDGVTKDLMVGLQKKYSKVRIVENERNLGFVKTVNNGIRESNSPYVLLLNSDCLLTENSIPKMIRHMQKDSSVGLVSPVSNNSPVVTYEMLPGYSFIQMNSLFEKLFSGMSFDACTIVGNCLMISRSCVDAVGFLDEGYGRGYGEETDYQFRAHEKGFNAKIACDIYVYHKSEASFGSNPEADALRAYNHQMFMKRWKKQFNRRWEEYIERDPIEFINKHLEVYRNFEKSEEFDAIFFLPGISQHSGGIHVVIELVNELILSGLKVGVVAPFDGRYDERLFTKPIIISEEKDFLYSPLKAKAIVATLFNTVKICFIYSRLKNCRLIYFVQGYEGYFLNGNEYGAVEKTYHAVDEIITISGWLQKKIEDCFQVQSRVFHNGINELVFYPGLHVEEQIVLTLILRGDSFKGDWILHDIVRLLSNSKADNLKINVIYFQDIQFSQSNKNVTYIKGPLTKGQISKILRGSTFFLDASLHEGFGLLPLEAMACGAIPIVSDSGGVLEFIEDGLNGFVIREVNKPEAYVQKINELIADKEKRKLIREKAIETSRKFYFRNTSKNYIEYFRNIDQIPMRKFLFDSYISNYVGNYYSKDPSIVLGKNYSLQAKVGFFILKPWKIPEFIFSKLKRFIFR